MRILRKKENNLDNQSESADIAYEKGLYREAYDLYAKVRIQDAENWQAVYKQGICQYHITYSLSSLLDDVLYALEIIKRTHMSKDKRMECYLEMCNALMDTALSLYKTLNTSRRYHNIKKDVYQIRFKEYVIILINAATLLKPFEELKEDRIKLLRLIIKHTKGVKYLTEEFNEADKELSEIDDSYTRSRQGCYIATCVYGSYDCPHVWTLRRYRDNKLAKTRRGRAFIGIYYKISPILVKWFGNKKWFKRIWKKWLDKKVSKLQNEGYESTPYEDKKR